jgi:hypothetical protein
MLVSRSALSFVLSLLLAPTLANATKPAATDHEQFATYWTTGRIDRNSGAPQRGWHGDRVATRLHKAGRLSPLSICATC